MAESIANWAVNNQILATAVMLGLVVCVLGPLLSHAINPYHPTRPDNVFRRFKPD